MDIDQKLDQAIEFIAHSSRELNEGKVVVLEGFQNDVAAICREINNLPQNVMLTYAVKLQSLSNDLKTLEKELRQQQMSVQKDIFSLNRKQKGLKAYQTMSHATSKDEDNGNS